MKNLFEPLAAIIYKKWKSGGRTVSDIKVHKALSRLYPLADVEKIYDDHQIKKLALVLLVLVIGIVSAVCLHLCSRMEDRLAGGAQLFRNEWGAGNYKVMLQAKTRNWSRKIPFLVDERKFTDDEQEKLLSRLYQELPDVIKKENQDLYHVTGNLNLVSALEGYPFRLSWNSKNTQRIGRDGKVERKGIGEEGEWAELTVRVSGTEKDSSFTYKVFLLPEALKEEESFFRLLEDKLLAIDSEGKSQKQILLPLHLNGENITWKEIKQDYTVFLLALTLLGCVLVWKGMENDLERECKKRSEQLVMEYPGFVSKLRLYLSAGLNVKNAFIKMRSDYGSRKNEKNNYLWEEIKIVCYQLENGVMEEQAYQELGRRCGEMRYRRLSFLLSVHLKQGNSQLLMLLAEEADNAQEDRRKTAKKMGEEAGTKLLLPMMMMLIVVMFLVLIPAYMDFGNI